MSISIICYGLYLLLICAPSAPPLAPPALPFACAPSSLPSTEFDSAQARETLLVVRSGGLRGSLCPALFSWAIGVTEIHTESGTAFPMHHTHQTYAANTCCTRRTQPPSIRYGMYVTWTVATKYPNACADDTHCVSTHGKQDSANGNRKRREEGDRSPWCIRLSSFPEDGHHRPESAIRHGARNDGARLRSPRRKAPRTPSRPHGAPRSSVQGSHTHTHAARPCNEPQKTRTIAEYNARAFLVLPSVLHSLPPSLPPSRCPHPHESHASSRPRDVTIDRLTLLEIIRLNRVPTENSK